MSITGKDFRGIQIAGANPMELIRLRARQEDQGAQAQGLKNASNNGKLNADAANAAGGKDVQEAATQFEALLLHQMFQSMWSTVQGEGILSGSKEEEYFRDMFTQGLADAVAKGQGIGIKEVIAKEMYKTEARSRGNGNKD